RKAEAYELLGRSYHQLRSIDRAIESYEQALKLSHKRFDATYDLGSIYITSNQPQPGAIAFQDALRVKPDDPLPMVGIGNCFFQMKRYDEATLMFQRVIDVSPGVKESIENLALLNKLTPKKESN